jgi:hypothetical protein
MIILLHKCEISIFFPAHEDKMCRYQRNVLVNKFFIKLYIFYLDTCEMDIF